MWTSSAKVAAFCAEGEASLFGSSLISSSRKGCSSGKLFERVSSTGLIALCSAGASSGNSSSSIPPVGFFASSGFYVFSFSAICAFTLPQMPGSTSPLLCSSSDSDYSSLSLTSLIAREEVVYS